MNAQLLTIMPNAAPAKSGIGALLSNSPNTKDTGASFADLLGQQADTIDNELLEMLGALGLEPQAQKELLAQLKELGIEVKPDQLNKLMQQIKNTDDPKQLLTVLRTFQTNTASTATNSTTLAQDSTHFINSTLFVANESKAMRSGLNTAFALPTTSAAVLGNLNKSETNPKDVARFNLSPQDGLKTDSRFDVRFDLSNKSLTDNPKTNNLSGFQSAFTAANDAAKAAAPSVTSSSNALPTELNGLSAQSHAPEQARTVSANAFNPTYSAQITTPLSQTAQWGADFGRVMVQMSQQAGQNSQAGLQTAEIRLDPPELGPLRIMLSINEGVANAMIFAAHAQTRHAIELSLPQLQQQLAQSGLSLGEANVSDQNFFAQSDQHADQGSDKKSEVFSLNGTDHASEADSLLSANSKQSIDPNAIIDTFA